MFTSALLMAPAEGGGSGYSSLIFLVLIMVVFYFFFIRPQAKKAKDLRKYREALKKGDKIVTIGGIHGKIVEVQETTFTIEVEDGTRLRIEKSAVAGDASDQLANQQK
ncbi:MULTISPECIES: preprotein translocase subunit YajC [Lentimicrobium]|jgi:preprotein translocase subunit YajC|uniref:Sec translocon accessory complex subunit YajC n=1 Tax=Lentimicrobium saccharophilum TaxID=1678841 RepID=A0A0S7BWF2_9BACT|nr:MULTISPECIES: preprotein translocase subunit YajC [Lentimicrobium]MCO5256686.1 preprotein translocase subunit YajC [Lentimicrobium sp.]MCO5261875.1 preprotein translocase subunit YajC [Lentimicrobium sp.]GAP42727.1 preprotein translocase, YajC subunit [Lentimicrobium saccharophilum]HOP12503.1 preprotein translocase subunit YajC [Lentimicrobium sp.]HPF64386.1 preprotein translocase subunit YajC [Lentimicrobium sp.]